MGVRTEEVHLGESTTHVNDLIKVNILFILSTFKFLRQIDKNFFFVYVYDPPCTSMNTSLRDDNWDDNNIKLTLKLIKIKY